MAPAVTTVGERFAQALLAKDWDGVTSVLDPAIDFRGLTPGRAWEATTPRDLIDGVFCRWFAADDEIYEVLSMDTDDVAGRARVIYRFRVRNPGGDYVCEQTAYYDAGPEQITKLRVLCSGFVPSNGST